MKSAIALTVASAALSTAASIHTDWVYEVVTVTVTADPTDYVQANKPTSAPEPAPPAPTTTQAAPSPPPPPPAPVANNAAAEDPQTSAAQAPPAPTPEPVETPEPAPAPESSSAGSETIAPSGSLQKTGVDFHNAYRQDHGASNVQWDDELAQYAANSANSCVFEHDMNQGRGGYGQNIASYGSTGSLGSDEEALGNAIANQWYPEVKNYNYYGAANPPAGVDFGKIGHFTQLVWKDSQKIGCAVVKCPAGSVLSYPAHYIVCNYSPPGNFNGRYADNVGPSKGLSITVSA